MAWFILFASLIIVIVLHEIGHALMAILLKVQVEVFSVGFWKPYWKFNWKGIEWRITPWLVGGYCRLVGETTKAKNGFLVQPYRKKLLIVLAGVFVNLITAFVCYLINYRNIWVGVKLDWYAIQSCFTNDYTNVAKYYLLYQPNMFLWQLSMISLFSFVVNIFPIPALDGSYVWLPFMEKVWKQNYIRNLNILCTIGFVLLNLLQVVLILWMFLR